MKKVTLSILSLFFAMFLFVACNNPANNAAQENDTPAAVEEVVVEVDTVAVEVDTVNVEVTVEEVVE